MVVGGELKEAVVADLSPLALRLKLLALASPTRLRAEAVAGVAALLEESGRGGGH